MRALPFTFQDVDAPEATVVRVTIRSDAGGERFVVRSGQEWTQVAEATGKPTANVTLTQDSVWKLFTKRLDHTESLRRFPNIQLEGDDDLCRRVIDMVSVMA